MKLKKKKTVWDIRKKTLDPLWVVAERVKCLKLKKKTEWDIDQKSLEPLRIFAQKGNSERKGRGKKETEEEKVIG